jgi:hypothetical protein
MPAILPLFAILGAGGYDARMRFAILVTAMLAVFTALGIFVGWAMNDSLLPPGGGGLACYVHCIATVLVLPAGIVALSVVPAVCRWITRILSA